MLSLCANRNSLLIWRGSFAAQALIRFNCSRTKPTGPRWANSLKPGKNAGCARENLSTLRLSPGGPKINP
jgi:hypothetical protein